MLSCVLPPGPLCHVRFGLVLSLPAKGLAHSPEVHGRAQASSETRGGGGRVRPETLPSSLCLDQCPIDFEEFSREEVVPPVSAAGWPPLKGSAHAPGGRESGSGGSPGIYDDSPNS